MNEYTARDESLFNQIHDLAAACLEGDVTADRFRQIQKLVCTDPEARRIYLEYLNDSISLRTIASASTKAEIAGAESSGDAWTVSSDRPMFAPLTSNSQTPGVSIGYFVSGWPVAYLLATVIFGIGLVVGAVVHVSQPGQYVGPGRTVESPRRQPPLPDPSTFIARVTGMVDCECEGTGFRVQRAGDANHQSEIRNQKSLLRLGDRLALKSGLLEITYDTGARVILQGPVTYEIASNNSGFLAIGKLAGNVNAEAAKGFAVRTPTAIVTDLGTEFGVEVSGDGATEMQTFAGTVKVTRVGGGPNDPEQVIRAGAAVRVGRGETALMAIPVGKCRFVRSISSATADREDDYAKMVLAMRPTAYYRMERPTTAKTLAVLRDSTAAERHGEIFFSEQYFGSPYGRGRLGDSLLFRGSMVRDYAKVSHWPDPRGDCTTVSAWACLMSRPLAGQWGYIVGNYTIDPKADPAIPASVLHFRLTIQGDPHKCAEAALRQRDGKTISVCDPTEFPLGTWQHLAMTADGSRIRLYRNGVEVGVSAYDGLMAWPGASGVSLGCAMNARGTAPAEGLLYFWPGRIDELAIFPRGLSSEEIMKLYRGAAAKANDNGPAH